MWHAVDLIENLANTLMSVGPAMALDNWGVSYSICAFGSAHAICSNQASNRPQSPWKGGFREQCHPHQVLQLSPLPWHSHHDSLNSDMYPPKTKEQTNPLEGSSIISSPSLSSSWIRKPSAFYLQRVPSPVTGSMQSFWDSNQERNKCHLHVPWSYSNVSPQGLVALVLLDLREKYQREKEVNGPKDGLSPSAHAVCPLLHLLNLWIHFKRKKEPLAEPWRKRILFYYRKKARSWLTHFSGAHLSSFRDWGKEQK